MCDSESAHAHQLVAMLNFCLSLVFHPCLIFVCRLGRRKLNRLNTFNTNILRSTIIIMFYRNFQSSGGNLLEEEDAEYEEVEVRMFMHKYGAMCISN